MIHPQPEAHVIGCQSDVVQFQLRCGVQRVDRFQGAIHRKCFRPTLQERGDAGCPVRQNHLSLIQRDMIVKSEGKPADCPDLVWLEILIQCQHAFESVASLRIGKGPPGAGHERTHGPTELPRIAIEQFFRGALRQQEIGLLQKRLRLFGR